MKRIICILPFILLFLLQHSFAQQMLEVIGQTPGGAGYHVNWDQTNEKLIVGAGCNVYVYDMLDPQTPELVARRPLLGPITETNLMGNILFVAATRDGVYALDYTSPNLDIIDHYYMKEMGDSGAYGMCRSNDTLYIADFYKVRMLKFDTISNQLNYITRFGGPRAMGVDCRGNRIAVVGQIWAEGFPPVIHNGSISIFSIHDLNSPINTWSSNLLDVVMDVQFADNNDDIIYVCGGPGDILFHTSNFLAFEFNGTTIEALDTFKITGGIPGYAQYNIINMDSRNDTVFIATTAYWDALTLPWCHVIVLDATDLSTPGGKMNDIAHIAAGLWHFDVALMDGTDYAAIASEWGGVIITDVSQLNFLDTLKHIPTGGWNKNNKVKDNQLWACMEGYGLVVYDIDSLLFENGFWCDSEIMHLQYWTFPEHFFSSEIEFLNDTLIIINTSAVYNIKPWLLGGEPDLLWDMNKGFGTIKKITTNVGDRIVTSAGVFDLSTTSYKYWIDVYNPYDVTNGFPLLYNDTTNNNYTALAVSNDTIYYGKKHTGPKWYLFAAKLENDQFVILDSIEVTHIVPLTNSDILGISVDNGIISIGYTTGLALYNWSGNNLNKLHHVFGQRNAVAVQLRNNYLYVVDKFYGVKIYDVSNNTINNLNPVAQARGSGGWMNPFGSNAISVAADGRIYLSDFLAGVIIIEAWDTTYISSTEDHFLPEIGKLHVYPNPSDGNITIELEYETGSIIVFDNSGQKVYGQLVENKTSNHNLSMLPAGVYHIMAVSGNQRSVSKIIISH